MTTNNPRPNPSGQGRESGPVKISRSELQKPPSISKKAFAKLITGAAVVATPQMSTHHYQSSPHNALGMSTAWDPSAQTRTAQHLKFAKSNTTFPVFGSEPQNTSTQSDRIACMNNHTQLGGRHCDKLDMTSPKLKYTAGPSNGNISTRPLEPHNAMVLAVHRGLVEESGIAEADFQWLFPDSHLGSPAAEVGSPLVDEIVADRILAGAMDMVHSMHVNGHTKDKKYQDRLVTILHTMEAKLQEHPCPHTADTDIMPPNESGSHHQRIEWDRWTPDCQCSFMEDLIMSSQSAHRNLPSVPFLVRTSTDLRHYFFEIVNRVPHHSTKSALDAHAINWVKQTEWTRDLLREELAKDIVRMNKSADGANQLYHYDSWVNTPARTSPGSTIPKWLQDFQREEADNIQMLVDFAGYVEYLIKSDDKTRSRHYTINVNTSLVTEATDEILNRLQESPHKHMLLQYLRDRLVIDEHTSFGDDYVDLPEKNYPDWVFPRYENPVTGLDRWESGKYLLGNKAIHDIMVEQFLEWDQWAWTVSYTNVNNQAFALEALFMTPRLESKQVECDHASLIHHDFHKGRCDLLEHARPDPTSRSVDTAKLLGTATVSAIFALFHLVFSRIRARMATTATTPVLRPQFANRTSIPALHDYRARSDAALPPSPPVFRPQFANCTSIPALHAYRARSDAALEASKRTGHQ